MVSRARSMFCWPWVVGVRIDLKGKDFCKNRKHVLVSRRLDSILEQKYPVIMESFTEIQKRFSPKKDLEKAFLSTIQVKAI